MVRILLVSDDLSVWDELRRSPSMERWTARMTAAPHEIVALLQAGWPDVVLLTHQPNGFRGLDVAEELRRFSTDSRIIVVLADALSPDVVARARRLRVLAIEQTERTRLLDVLAALGEQVARLERQTRSAGQR
jgi:DNA-binding response OmpR family regulator